MAKKKVVRKFTRAEQITAGIARSHHGLSDFDLISRASTVVASILDTETEIARLRAELSKYNARLAASQAELAGIERVLARQ